MLNTPFPRPIKGLDLAPATQIIGPTLGDDTDLSQEELARAWLQLVAPSRVRVTRGYVPKDEVNVQMPKVSLFAYIAYLTLLIRLSKSYIAGQVSGSIFTALIFDWTRRLGRHASVAGFRLGAEYDNLVDKADQYPELEEEKGVYGMLDDQKLRSLAQEILSSLEQLWAGTKSKLDSGDS